MPHDLASSAPSARPGYVTMILAACGMAVSGTLTVAHYTNRLVPCGPDSGCERVQNDPSSMFIGLPVAVYGLLAYATILALATLLSIKGKQGILPMALSVTVTVGVCVSGLLTWHSVTVIHAVCQWCLGSALIMLGLLFTTLAWLRKPIEPLPPKQVTGLAALLLSLAGGGVFAIAQVSSSPGPAPVVRSGTLAEIIPEGVPVRGGDTAKVTIVEFADLNCRACKEMHGRLLKLLSHYPGQIQLAFRHLPLTTIAGHETSYEAAVLAASTASPDQTWAFIDLAYSESRPLTKERLKSLYESVVGNAPAPNAKAESERTVKRDMTAATKLGIRQTPTYIVFVRGKRVGVATSLDLLPLLQRPEVLAAINDHS